MTTQDSQPSLGFTLRRVLAATPERVFRAFTDPDWYSQWWGPPGCSSQVRQLDLEVGGAYAIVMTLPDGSQIGLRGTYREIEPPRVLAYSFQWEGDELETLVTVELEPHADGTELIVTHEGFTDQEFCDEHEKGWAGSLERMVELLASAD